MIATPSATPLRARVGARSSAGKHVFVEKPLAASVEGAAEIVALAERASSS